MNQKQIKQAVAEFKQIYKEEYGVELSDYEATEKSNMLLQLFDSLTNTPKGDL